MPDAAIWLAIGFALAVFTAYNLCALHCNVQQSRETRAGSDSAIELQREGGIVISYRNLILMDRGYSGAYIRYNTLASLESSIASIYSSSLPFLGNYNVPSSSSICLEEIRAKQISGEREAGCAV